MKVLLIHFIYGYLFFFFSARIAVANTYKTMLNSSGESGHPCLVPDFRGNAFNFSPLRIMFAVVLSYIAFIMLRYVPYIPAFWRVFIINGFWIFSKAFSVSIEIIIWILSFNLLMWFITLIDLQISKNPCIPGKKPIWSLCMIFLICCWILFARILLRIFVSMFISDIGLSMNIVKLQDTKLTHRNLLHSYTLTMRKQKEKLRKQYHSPLQQKE